METNAVSTVNFAKTVCGNSKASTFGGSNFCGLLGCKFCVVAAGLLASSLKHLIVCLLEN